MHNIINVRPSVLLVSLIQNAKLSNAVSRIALRNANKQWVAHIAKSVCNRDQKTLINVADQLRLIILQVSQRRCRINPMYWVTLIHLESDLRNAYTNNINLEPLLDTVAANSDHNEVA